MARIEWSQSLNTDIPEIDAQHQQLVSYVNELDEAISNKDRPAVNHVLEELIAYTVFHFKSEKTLMEDIGYKYIIPHLMTHDLFIRRVEEYKKRFDAGEDIAKELYEVLVHWLLQHIQHEDQGYAAEIHHRKEAQASLEDRGLLSTLKHFFHLD